MKKTSKKNISITHESKKTIVIVDGEEVDLSEVDNNANLLELLNNSSLDNDLISEILHSASNLSQNTTKNEINANATIKIECSSCSRTVSYAKGHCIYCGHKLKLPSSTSSKNEVNEIDAKYLDTDEIESKEDNVDVNYIDRLKDI